MIHDAQLGFLLSFIDSLLLRIFPYLPCYVGFEFSSFLLTVAAFEIILIRDNSRAYE